MLGRHWVFILSFALGAAPTLAAQSEADATAFFESKIRPALIERCYECHAGSRGKLKGGLDLESRAGWVTGGDSGPAVIPGDPDSSLLIRALRHTDEELRMPPSGKLPAGLIGDFETWVRRGAVDPRTAPSSPAGDLPIDAARKDVDWQAARGFWAFAPLVTSPDASSTAPGGAAIDVLVRARLKDHGLDLAPQADRRTLIRRVAYNLTGLPPTQAELTEYVDDPAADAHEKMVDRYLASPHYGERFARHWLDVARYADSNGADENVAYAHAWRYRDWVVRAFNEDKPYDRFVIEQVAGDLLPETSDLLEIEDRAVGTGFLALGPKMLAEQDKEKLVMDVVDEQLDVLGRAFLGLTIGCARCHDHKFDPITHADYYALAGVLRSTESFAELGHVSRWTESEIGTSAEIATLAAWRKEAADAAAAKDASRRQAESEARNIRRNALAELLLAGDAAARQSTTVEAEDMSRGNLKSDASEYGDVDCTLVHTGAKGLQSAEWDVVLESGGRFRLDVRYAAAESRPVTLDIDGKTVSPAALATPTGGWKAEHMRWTTVADTTLPAGRSIIRLARSGDFPHVDKFQLIRLDPVAGTTSWTTGPSADPKLTPDVIRQVADFLERTERRGDRLFLPWHAYAALPADGFAGAAAARLPELRRSLGDDPAAALLDGPPPHSLREVAVRYQTLVSTVLAGLDRARKAAPDAKTLAEPGLESIRRVIDSPGGLAGPTVRIAVEEFTEAGQAESARLATIEAAVHARKPADLPRAMAVRDGAPVDLAIHVRGSHLSLASATTPRRFLELFAWVPAEAIPDGVSGRLQLARHLTRPEHPLTARVLVNRIWQAHFGRGIVASPSNFGLRGDLPDNQPLLDRLAADFVRGGWSIKRLQRQILTSATFKQESDATAEILEKDAENRVWSRFPRRRLDAESIRDSILAVSGRLDRTLGGSLLQTKNFDYVTNDQSANQVRYDVPRRSLYLPIIRNAMFEFFAAFDYPDPSTPLDVRPSTTVAQQALWLMNSPFVIGESERLAKGLVDDATLDTGGRIDRLYRMCLSRPPTADETALLAAHVDSFAGADGAPPLKAWTSACQALICSNEFLHLD